MKRKAIEPFVAYNATLYHGKKTNFIICNLKVLQCSSLKSNCNVYVLHRMAKNGHKMMKYEIYNDILKFC